jgi:glycosyltransferase involved in cell wall biosynthesis
MTKIMDYMALGKASVQFDLIEGRRSAGEASVYARPNDEGDLARQIVALAEDDARRAELRRLGRRRLEESLEWRHQIPRLIAAHERARAKWRGRRRHG